jgi:hypothetical protein
MMGAAWAVRSTPDDTLLATIPPAKVIEIQLADATLALQGRDLTDDLLRFRRLPGEGELPITRVVSVLKRMGAWRSVVPEVVADAMDALDAREAGRRCGASTERWLAAISSVPTSVIGERVVARFLATVVVAYVVDLSGLSRTWSGSGSVGVRRGYAAASRAC